MVFMPPRHGKSELVSHFFPSWYLMSHPEKKIILASYQEGFAASWGRKARDVVEEHGDALFGVHVRGDSSAAARWQLDGHDGEMICAGAGGSITGKGGNVAIIDDPVKNADEAGSLLMRDKNWEWYKSTFITRLTHDGAVILVMTRWNQDDLAGRLLKEQESGGDKWDVVDFPAVAEADDEFRKSGDALCPEMFPLAVLRERERELGRYWWAALYQQHPVPFGGNMFSRANFPIVDSVPNHAVRVRFWDLAASTDGKRTAGVKLAKDASNTYYVENVVKGQWTPGDRDERIVATAKEDGRTVRVLIEQEPGSGGLAQVEYLIKALAGFRASGDRVTGDKITRAGPVASQSEIKNVKMLRGVWNQDFLDELEAFPNGQYMDQVDGLSGAFNLLCKIPVHVTGFGTKPPSSGVVDEFHPQSDRFVEQTALSKLEELRRIRG